ncbi:SusC/RagA family TonB-linked outer membrane protein [Sphingobacterium pedocola]|uniref:TonB-dependent receptor plug domain-containing protein n=1 Tax=Sphingobacterium pedocola TaxID=2082722 RepID=A0ABR9T992_9SPHI|nr:SusC/RagA family TonB-linked outer membrane protein [Sphingobacterium pedocola]MBE8721916.1 hypothetical protein [Sphingobacterium pedocola]
MKILLLFFMLAISYTGLYAQQACSIDVVVVRQEDGRAMPNINIEMDGRSFKTDHLGRVTLHIDKEAVDVRIRHVGYTVQTLTVRCSDSKDLQIAMVEEAVEIDSVYVSTGYEKIPRERATGSFEFIDNSLLNRSVGTNIIARLENITTGLHFNKQSVSAVGGGLAISPQIVLHGISTIRDHANRSSPLIILDNFPYEGDINDINPAEIDNITILKDAAATSIWGAKAGNGVIVLTSKYAGMAEGIKGSFGSTVSITQKPDLMRHQVISPGDYIDVERFLFDKGYYSNLETNRSRPALSPAVELFIAERDGTLSIDEINTQLAVLRSQDVRRDFAQYLYRNALLHQYNLNLNGRSAKSRFVLSAGYDNSAPTQLGRDYERGNIRIENVYQPTKNIDITTSMRWSVAQARSADAVPVYAEIGYRYPYIRLADDQGNAIPIPKDYRLSYIDQTGQGLLMDWHYRPLDEVANQPTTNLRKDLILNTGIKYRWTSWFNLDLKYQYADVADKANSLYDLANYRTRNQINLGSTISNGAVIYNFPYGSVLQDDLLFSKGHYGRAQANMNRSWSDRHDINGLLGFEFNARQSASSGYTIVGYDENTLAFPTGIDYLKPYPVYDNLQATSAIGQPLRPMTALEQRYMSYFGNASYSYDSRYVVSMSVRKDASNLFGVATNDKWSPLWSVGGRWNASKESFFSTNWMSTLTLRASYGFSGNIDNSLSAVPTLSFLSPAAAYLVPWQRAQNLNAPNAELRWEKVRNINFGLDFGLANKKVSGSIDIYHKSTKDLYTSVPMDPTTGISAMVINGANVNGKGVDLQIKTVNIDNAIKWSTNWLFSYNNTWIKRNFKEYAGPADLTTAGLNTVEGHLAFPMYSYRWGGLDPQTGEPRGLLNGEPSKDYRALRSQNVQPEDLVFHGSRRPLYWGGVRNNVNYKNFSLSANVSWKAGYYFRRESIDYSYVLNNGLAHSDYYRRWQKAGDEASTDVPAFIYPVNSLANTFYANSEVLVEKGDHIYLDDIRMDYSCRISQSLRMNLYLMASNIGMIWSASSSGQFPDNASSIPMPRIFSCGFNLNF